MRRLRKKYHAYLRKEGAFGKAREDNSDSSMTSSEGRRKN